MGKLGPISLHDFVKYLRKLGFEGPFRGGKHLFMLKDNLRLTIPNPHRKEISVDLLLRLLKQAGISKKTWLSMIKWNT